jgi:hypothetical protein
MDHLEGKRSFSIFGTNYSTTSEPKNNPPLLTSSFFSHDLFASWRPTGNNNLSANTTRQENSKKEVDESQDLLEDEQLSQYSTGESYWNSTLALLEEENEQISSATRR